MPASSPLDPQYQRAIESLLQQDLQTVRELNELLLQEREALKGRDYQQQSHLIEEKNRRLNLLDANRQKRERLLSTLEQPITKAAWEQLIKNAENPQLQQLWRSLQEAFAECQEANQVNGKMIGRSRQIFGRLLSIVRGQVETPELYNQKGGRQVTTGNHQFIEV